MSTSESRFRIGKGARGNGPMIRGRQAIWYTGDQDEKGNVLHPGHTRAQLLIEEPDHSKLSPAEVADIERELSEKWSGSQLPLPPAPLSLPIPKGGLPPAKLGEDYRVQLKAQDGYPYVTFKIDPPKLSEKPSIGELEAATFANLPPGLTLSPGGIISGTPQLDGEFNFTVIAENLMQESATQTFTISVEGLPAHLEERPAGEDIQVPAVQPPPANQGQGQTSGSIQTTTRQQLANDPRIQFGEKTEPENQ